MKPPTVEEVEQYMRDKVDSKYESAIQDIVQLAGAVDMPYDFLRAIAFELNQGYSLKETMQDLNITKANNLVFDIKAYRKDNVVYEAWNESLDLTSRDRAWIDVSNYDSVTGKREIVALKIYPYKAHLVGGEYIINEDIINPHYTADEFWQEDDETARKLAAEMNEKMVFDRIVLTRVKTYGTDRYLI